MKYYQNKTTGEIIGVENMREVIDLPTDKSEKLGYRGYSYHIVYDMICPNHLIPNGPVSFCITHGMLTTNYKRISKEKALSVYPNFRQYRYFDLENESRIYNKTRLEIIQNQTF